MDIKTALAAAQLANQIQSWDGAISGLQAEIDSGTSLARLATILDPIMATLPDKNKSDLLNTLLTSLQTYQSVLSKQLDSM